MKQKNSKSNTPFFFSTDPEMAAKMQAQFEEENKVETLPNDKQILRVSRDAKQRGGKEVTLIKGFEGSDEDLQALGKKLKASCGVGGSAKDNEIIIQGNHVERVLQLLITWGYTKAKKSGA